MFLIKHKMVQKKRNKLSMHYVYILKSENGKYYIGETKNICKRLHQHKKGIGSVNTSQDKQKELLGLYWVPSFYCFSLYKQKIFNFEKKNEEGGKNLLEEEKENIKIHFERNYEYKNYKEEGLKVENMIAEEVINSKNIRKDEIIVHGGKYTTDNSVKEYIENGVKNDIPKCECGIPCDVAYYGLGKRTRICYVCPRRHISKHINEKIDYIISKSCNYCVEYVDDIEYRVNSFSEK